MNETTAAPPDWAEAFLRLALKYDDRDSVSGDLLEEYRERVRGGATEAACDAWYVRQVAGFIVRATWLWALLFSVPYVARGAYDWLVPTTYFYTRSAVTTRVAVATLLCVGLWAGWRSRSIAAAIFVTAVVSQIAAVLSVIGVSILLLAFYSTAVRTAIDGSGGLEEAYVLPFMFILPALIFGALGGTLGSISRRLIAISGR
jgi:hypothetical protein